MLAPERPPPLLSLGSRRCGPKDRTRIPLASVGARAGKGPQLGPQCPGAPEPFGWTQSQKILDSAMFGSKVAKDIGQEGPVQRRYAGPGPAKLWLPSAAAVASEGSSFPYGAPRGFQFLYSLRKGRSPVGVIHGEGHNAQSLSSDGSRKFPLQDRNCRKRAPPLPSLYAKNDGPSSQYVNSSSPNGSSSLKHCKSLFKWPNNKNRSPTWLKMIQTCEPFPPNDAKTETLMGAGPKKHEPFAPQDPKTRAPRTTMPKSCPKTRTLRAIVALRYPKTRTLRSTTPKSCPKTRTLRGTVALRCPKTEPLDQARPKNPNA